MNVPVAFLTLFLGLVSGPQTLELVTTAEVGGLELLLDGRSVGRLVGPPWTTRIDFGPALAPHELIAVARDAEGRELGRVRQLVNAARPPAEVRLLVDREATGRMRSARWVGGAVSTAAIAARPEIEMSLDGRALRVDGDGRASLPEIDLATPHVLSALVTFGPGVSARHDLVLGGSVNDEALVELTAVPFDLPTEGKRRADPKLSDLSARFAGRPIQPTALDRGPAQVFMVRPSEVDETLLWRFGGRGQRPSKSALTFSGGQFDSGDRSARRFEARLERDDRIRMLWPHPTSVPGASLPTRLFQGSREFRGETGGFFWLLSSVEGPPEAAEIAPRFADAVAVAGLQALASGRRRAVVLLLDGSASDPSFYDPASVRRFLRTARVPLVVWSSVSRSPLAAAWGGAVDVSSPSALERAVRELREILDRQRILWLPGTLLPGTVDVQVSTP